ncbi:MULTISPECIES: hypothetical protein [Xanthomonas]|uniref:hypothetical protein n=1 Tax=Xanthomonas TaxID=338 RepID=UPI000E1EDAE1|nr:MULTISPECIES: hypothetical protein [Xanthomonas]
MSRTYHRALAIGWTVVAIMAATCVPLRLAELHAAQRTANPPVVADGAQAPALPHVRLAQSED